jgi:hypothetical protein
VGMGTPELIKRIAEKEAGSGSDRTCSTLDVAPIAPPHCHPAAGCRQSAPADSHEPRLRGCPPQGKPGRMPGLSVKQPPPISTSGQSRTSASWQSAPRKAGQDARSFRKAAAANEHQRAEARQGKADRMSALSVTQLPPMSTSGQSRTSASWLFAPRKAGQDARSFRKAAAANEHQRTVTNLGFVAVRPKESRAECPVFP